MAVDAVWISFDRYLYVFYFRVVKLFAVRRIFLREQKYDASHRFSRNVNIDDLPRAVLFPFECFEQCRVVVPQLSSDLVLRLYLICSFFTLDGSKLKFYVGQFVGSDTLTGLGEQNFVGFRKFNSVFHMTHVVRCVRPVRFENFSELDFQNLLVFFQKNGAILADVVALSSPDMSFRMFSLAMLYSNIPSHFESLFQRSL